MDPHFNEKCADEAIRNTTMKTQEGQGSIASSWQTSGSISQPQPGQISPETLCEKCKWFAIGQSDSRFHPGEPDECGHPKLYALMSANMRRGPIRSCKGFMGRGMEPQEHRA